MSPSICRTVLVLLQGLMRMMSLAVHGSWGVVNLGTVFQSFQFFALFPMDFDAFLPSSVLCDQGWASQLPYAKGIDINKPLHAAGGHEDFSLVQGFTLCLRYAMQTGTV